MTLALLMIRENLNAINGNGNGHVLDDLTNSATLVNFSNSDGTSSTLNQWKERNCWSDLSLHMVDMQPEGIGNDMHAP